MAPGAAAEGGGRCDLTNNGLNLGNVFLRLDLAGRAAAVAALSVST